MWRYYFRCTVTAMALGLSLSALPWIGIAAPAKRSAPTAPPGPAPTEDERALALFKAKAEQFQRFLAQEPLILDKQDFSKSPTGVIFHHVRIRLLESSIDVQRSDSLISPFIGYLNLIYQTDNTIKCGDMVIHYSSGNSNVHGYTTFEKAMSRIHDCFQPLGFSDNVRLIFAYQDGRWVFKDAIRTENNGKAQLLLTALGRPAPGRYHLADNQAWESLIK